MGKAPIMRGTADGWKQKKNQHSHNNNGFLGSRMIDVFVVPTLAISPKFPFSLLSRSIILSFNSLIAMPTRCPECRKKLKENKSYAFAGEEDKEDSGEEDE